MKLKNDTKYAFQILQYLCLHEDRPTAMDIANEIGISYSDFIKIAHQLAEQELIKAIQGRKGGYKLGRPAHEISVGDVYLCMEENPFLEEMQPCGNTQIHALAQKVPREIVETMSNTSIAVLGEHSPTTRSEQTPARIIEERKERHYPVFIGEQLCDIPFDDIFLFRSNAKNNTVEVYTEQDIFHALGKASRIALIAPEFFSTYPSHTVNINRIRHIDETKKEIELSNGRIVPIAKAKIARLINLLSAHRQNA